MRAQFDRFSQIEKGFCKFAQLTNGIKGVKIVGGLRYLEAFFAYF